MEKNSLIPTADEVNVYQILADSAAKSGYFQKIGGRDAIFSIGMYSRDVRQPMMKMLFGGMHNINGKIEMAAVTMNAMIREAGHKLEINCDNKICKIKGIRHDTKEEYSCTFSMDDAKQACLIKAGSGWERYPSDMLFARCIARLARRLFPDVIGPSYVEGEISNDQFAGADKEIQVKESIETVQVIEEEAPAELPQQEPTLSKDQARIIEKLIGEDDALFNRILDGYKVNNLQNISAKHFDIICGVLKKRNESKPKEMNVETA